MKFKEFIKELIWFEPFTVVVFIPIILMLIYNSTIGFVALIIGVVIMGVREHIIFREIRNEIQG